MLVVMAVAMPDSCTTKLNYADDEYSELLIVLWYYQLDPIKSIKIFRIGNTFFGE